jgi:hypothetical protein
VCYYIVNIYMKLMQIEWIKSELTFISYRQNKFLATFILDLYPKITARGENAKS